MKKIIAFLLCIFMLLPLMACDNTQSDKGDTAFYADDSYDTEDAMIASMDFSIKLLQTYAEENALISPMSIYFALGMLENGAKDESLFELEDVLGLNAGQMNSYAKEYMNQIPEELKIANSIWYTSHESFTVEDTFIQGVEGYFNAEVYEADFDASTCDEINSWVSDKTDGMIEEIIDEIPADAVMYLINALVFEAEWEDPYEERDIRKDEFTLKDGTKQTVDMMHSMESYYIEDKNATGFVKHYEGGEYAFVALLPNEGVELQDYIQSLTGQQMLNLLEKQQEIQVMAMIPQFQIEDDVKLKEILERMGISNVFDSEEADLSGLGSSTIGNLFVDEVFHKTYIEVSPVGTKAGAATVVAVDALGAIFGQEIKEVYLNRPFLYMIIDCNNNQPIFMGTVDYVH